MKFKVSLACIARPCLRKHERKEVFVEKMIDRLLLKNKQEFFSPRKQHGQSQRDMHKENTRPLKLRWAGSGIRTTCYHRAL